MKRRSPGLEPLAVLIAGLLVTSGCVSRPQTSPVAAGTPAIVLPQTQTLPVQYGVATLPGGRYTPLYQTRRGTWYSAPSSLFFEMSSSGDVLWPYLDKSPIQGGVCIARDKEGQEIHGVWVDSSYEKQESLPSKLAKGAEGDHPARRGGFMTLRAPLSYAHE